MLYEPVGYVMEYEISALVFLFVIVFRYFGTRRFPNQKNTIFSFILSVIVVDLILDIVSSLIIDHVFDVPLVVTYIVNGVFYTLQLLLPMLMTVYTFALAGHLDKKRIRRISPIAIPGGVMLFINFTNPLTHLIFYVDPVRGYVHSSLFIYTYMVCFFYMFVTFFVAYCYRARFFHGEFATICRFLIISFAAMIVQYHMPRYLLSGVAIALSVTLMYFTLQNPENMLDATTGAFTYEAMLTFLRDRAEEKRHVRLVAVKICNMSRLNELLGTENGSLLLAQICRFLRESAHDSWVFRMQGDCFVAITRNHQDYLNLCEQVNKRIGEAWHIDNMQIVIRATVCCIATSDLRSEPISPEQTVNYLDAILMQNERSDKQVNHIFGGPELLTKLERIRAVEAAFREALETGEGLDIYLQPLWSIRERRFVSAEALMRFHHAEMGVISPSEFVPIAEGNGLAMALDEFVLRRVCRFIRDENPQHRLGLEAIEINLSALEFMQHHWPDLLDSIVTEYGVDPSFLIFEITETAATESHEMLENCMQSLCARGYRFALDDFGTGYANINQVLRLPFSMVKLDRSLLSGPEIVLEDMARMFTRMNLKTVVEGVETPDHLTRMEKVPADYIQGFHYAMPMNMNDFCLFLDKETN